MSDAELIARLRSKRQKGNRFDSLEYEAADRIEALGKACTEWAEVSQSNYQRAKTSEAKLNKAVEALRQIADPISLAQGNVNAEIAHATIEEISSHNKGDTP